MKPKIAQKLIEEGFVLYTLWKSIKYHDFSDFRILELAVNREFISKYFKLFPLTKDSKKCGSFEYKYCKYTCKSVLADNDYFNHDNFSIVMFYSDFKFVDELVSNGVDAAKIEIQKYRKSCFKKYRQQNPKHTQCKLKLNDKCLCQSMYIKYEGLSRTKQIGLGVESKIKIPRVSSMDVRKDDVTTLKRKLDNHIIYVPGWAFDDKK
jgi:hypothetical protein